MADKDWVDSQDLGWMRGSTEALMPDLCDLYERQVTGRDSRNREVVAFPVRRADCPCSYNPRGGKEVQLDTAQTVVTDASIRLPIDCGVQHTDEVEVKTRYGEEVSPTIRFRVVGVPELRATAIICQLSRVQ